MQSLRSCVVTVLSASLLFAISSAAKADDAPAVTAPAAPANPDVVKDWNGSLALGMSLANGNSSAFQVNSASALDKQWKNDELHFGVNGAYAVTDPGSKSNQNVTANNLHGVASYRHLFDERLYAFATEEVMHDDVADITYRFVTSPGMGYYFVKEPATTLRGEAGPSWIYERVSGSDPGHHNYIAARFAERFDHSFNKNAKVWQSLEYLPQIDAWGNYLINAEVGAEAALTGPISLRLIARDQYNSEPPAGSKSNDIMLLAAVVYKFAK
jgi:putative salt-induced outer membrane protein YdiY